MVMRTIIPLLFTSMLAVSSISWAEAISVNSNDSIISVLTAQTGKRVSIKMKSGQEMTGTVTSVTDKLTHIAELAGKEFYDAVIINESIEAVVIRTK